MRMEIFIKIQKPCFEALDQVANLRSYIFIDNIPNCVNNSFEVRILIVTRAVTPKFTKNHKNSRFKVQLWQQL